MWVDDLRLARRHAEVQVVPHLQVGIKAGEAHTRRRGDAPREKVLFHIPAVVRHADQPVHWHMVVQLHRHFAEAGVVDA